MTDKPIFNPDACNCDTCKAGKRRRDEATKQWGPTGLVIKPYDIMNPPRDK